MKIGILTFHFAYNYGAMLQAYALKVHLLSKGHDVRIIPYFPVYFQRAYGISPFLKGISLKRRVYNILHYFRRAPQAYLFEQFKKDFFYKEHDIYDLDELNDYCKGLDCVIFGSDQIWNDSITHNDCTYMGEGLHTKKISYAASMANSRLSQKQIETMKKCLVNFKAISVREPDIKKNLEKSLDLKIEHVCDPVFLQTKMEWKKLESQVSIKQPYVLIYMLKSDEKLLRMALDYAREKKLKVYEIHPTLGMNHSGTISLKNVGPREFLYLINHSDCVCTNSFHAVSFSIIYRKKLLHIPNQISPERTVSLLDRIGAEHIENSYHINLDEYDYKELDDFIISSIEFLNDMLC